MNRFDDFFAWTIFWKVIKTGNLSRAAIDLNIAPTVASRIITELEESLKTKLLYRQKRPIVPTAEGELLYQEIGPLIAEFQRFAARHAALSIYHNSPFISSIRVSALLTYGHDYLHPLLNEYMHTHAHTCFCFYIGKTLSELESKKIDLLVADFEVNKEGLKCFPIRKIPSIILASPKYLRANGVPTVPQELVNHRALVLISEEADSGRYLIAKKKDKYVMQYSQHFFSENPVALREAAVNGEGVIFGLPLEFFLQEIKERKLVQILPGWHSKSFSRNIIVRAEDYEANEKLKEFSDWLVQKESLRSQKVENELSEFLGIDAKEYI